jgi:hypothetical protein
MPINNSGIIALGSGSIGQSINLQLGKAIDATISMNDNDVRVLAGKVGINPISFSDFYGKPVTPSITPSRTVTPTVTMTPSVTTTPAVTPSVTITPTVTMTPSLTPPIVYVYDIQYCNLTTGTISSAVQLSFGIIYDYGGCFEITFETLSSGFFPTITSLPPQRSCSDTECGGGGGPGGGGIE